MFIYPQIWTKSQKLSRFFHDNEGYRICDIIKYYVEEILRKYNVSIKRQDHYNLSENFTFNINSGDYICIVGYNNCKKISSVRFNKTMPNIDLEKDLKNLKNTKLLWTPKENLINKITADFKKNFVISLDSIVEKQGLILCEVNEKQYELNLKFSNTYDEIGVKIYSNKNQEITRCLVDSATDMTVIINNAVAELKKIYTSL